MPGSTRLFTFSSSRLNRRPKDRPMYRTECVGGTLAGSGSDRTPAAAGRGGSPARDRRPLPERPTRANGRAESTLFLALERPAFGQFARQVAPVAIDDLAECIADQRANGG